MVGNRRGNTRTPSNNGDYHDHNHIEEVIYDNDPHLGVPVEPVGETGEPAVTIQTAPPFRVA